MFSNLVFAKLSYAKSNPSVLTAVSVLLISFSTAAHAQLLPPDAASPQQIPAGNEPEFLDGGPLHEAFARPLALEGQSIVIDRQPPAPINELPPEERPEGANVNWLPGYWLFETERADFVWVSGLWRNFPPGRTWVPGEWQQVEAGFQWLPGFWADEQLEDQPLLPQPPATLEQGPSGPAPGNNYLWAPGCWQWHQSNYAWQPGFWYAAQPDWVWVPNHYSYTPRGAVYIRGYWDFPLARRGLLYAPVYWGAGYRVTSNFVYRPRTIVNTGLLIANLFVDHNRGRYYYGRSWGVGRNIPSWLSPWGNRSYGQWGRYKGRSNLYDPLWSHFRWDGHSRSGYGKFDQRDLAARHLANRKHANRKHSGKPIKRDDLFRQQDRLSSAQRQSLRLRSSSASEVAKFRKQAEKYRNFDRAKLARGQGDQRQRGQSGQRVQANNNGVLSQRIPQVNDDRRAGQGRARVVERGSLDRVVGGNNAKGSNGKNIANGNLARDRQTLQNQRRGGEVRLRSEAETRARLDSQLRAKANSVTAAQLRQRTQLRTDSSTQRANKQGATSQRTGAQRTTAQQAMTQRAAIQRAATQRANSESVKRAEINRQAQIAKQRQILSNQQSPTRQRQASSRTTGRTLDSQSLQQYLRSRSPDRGNARPGLTNGQPELRQRINQRALSTQRSMSTQRAQSTQRVAKPAVTRAPATSNTLRRRTTSSTRLPSSMQLNQRSSSRRVQQAAPQRTQLRTNSVRRSGGSSARSFTPRILHQRAKSKK